MRVIVDIIGNIIIDCRFHLFCTVGGLALLTKLLDSKFAERINTLLVKSISFCCKFILKMTSFCLSVVSGLSKKKFKFWHFKKIRLLASIWYYYTKLLDKCALFLI